MGKKKSPYKNKDSRVNIHPWKLEDNNFYSFNNAIQAFLTYFISVTLDEIGLMRNQHDWDEDTLNRDDMYFTIPVTKQFLRNAKSMHQPYKVFAAETEIRLENTKSYLGKINFECWVPEDSKLKIRICIARFEFINIVSAVNDDFFNYGYFQPNRLFLLIPKIDLQE